MQITQVKRKPGDFQQAIDEPALRAALGQQLGDETVIAVTEIAEGLFNNTYKVTTPNNHYIVKIAPPVTARVLYHEQFLMQREHALAHELASLSPLIPAYLCFFKVGERDAFIQPFIQGKLWATEQASLSAKENNALWWQLGRFGQLLHQHQGDKFGFPHPFQQFARWSEFIVDMVDGLIADCQTFAINCAEIADYRRLLAQLVAHLDQVTTPRLLHGDLWPRNVLFDGAGEDIHITAVIDAERAFWGDPVSDWVLILYGVPEAFWQGYGSNLPEHRDPVCVALYKGMYFIVNILEAAREQRNQSAAIGHLAQINQILAQVP